MAAATDTAKDAVAAGADAAKGAVSKVGSTLTNVALAPVRHPGKTLLIGGGLAFGGIAAGAIISTKVTAAAAAGTAVEATGLSAMTSLPFNAVGGAAATTEAAAAAAAPQSVLGSIGSATGTLFGHIGNGAYALGSEGYAAATTGEWAAGWEAFTGGTEFAEAGGADIAGKIGPNGAEGLIDASPMPTAA